jgi:hypothetical protein
MKKYPKYLIYLLILTLFLSCKKTTPLKDEIKENATTFTHLGELSQKQLEIKKSLDLYLKELQTFNTDNIVEMTYPKLFHAIDAELYRQIIVSLMNSTQINLDSYETNITKLSKPIRFSNDTEFAQAEYLAIQTVRFLDDNMYNTEENINYLYDAFIHKFGEENIHFDVKKRTITKRELKKLLIIKEKDSEWKFLRDSELYRKFYPTILPFEIYKIIEGGENNETT